jgi:hypothetical protein
MRSFVALANSCVVKKIMLEWSQERVERKTSMHMDRLIRPRHVPSIINRSESSGTAKSQNR